MSRRILSLAGVFFLVIAAAALAQQAEPILLAPPSQAECSGFIAGTPVPSEIWVLDGVDNDFHSPVRQFMPGESVFLHTPSGAQLSVGAEYAIVRWAKTHFRNSWFEGQAYQIRSRGTPYEDVGRVRITHLTGQGPVAAVTFACGPIYPGSLSASGGTCPP